MAHYEYKVVPAPAKGEKTRGVKGAEGRFAFAIERLMNEMAAGGWEYQRAETLPSEERSGLTSSHMVWRNLLVFRRPQTAGATDAEDIADLEDRRIASAADLAQPDALPETGAGHNDRPDDAETPTDDSLAFRHKARDDWDNGVEGTAALDGPSSVLTDRAARLRQDSAAE